MNRLTRPLLLTLVLCLITGVFHAQAQAANLGELCEEQIHLQEQAGRIPQDLLKAIAITESGRFDAGRQRLAPWPWTVMAKGEGKYFSSQREAVDYVRQLQAEGVTNIDVGCMQINLRWHGQHFSSLEQAFNPRENVQFAAQFLRSLMQETRSWTQAVARYHSSTPANANPYRVRVFNHWKTQRQLTNQDRRAAILAAHQERKVAREAAIIAQQRQQAELRAQHKAASIRTAQNQVTE